MVFCVAMAYRARVSHIQTLLEEEISTVQVGVIVEMVRKEPKLKPFIDEATKDGKITRSEYVAIEKERINIIRAGFMGELKGGDKSTYKVVKQ